MTGLANRAWAARRRTIPTGGGGSGGPNYVEDEAAKARDRLLLILSHPPELIRAGDALVASTTALDERPKARDVLASAVGTMVEAEAAKGRDAFAKAAISGLIVNASATPDTDIYGDTYAYEQQPTVNHGSDTTMLVQGDSALGGAEMQAGFEADFTLYSSMTAFAGGTHTFTFHASGPAVAVTLSVTVSFKATRPFVESTQVWPMPADGTLLGAARTFSVSGALAPYVVTLTDAQLNSLLGNWLYLRFSTADAAVAETTTMTVNTRNAAANKPVMAFDLKRS